MNRNLYILLLLLPLRSFAQPCVPEKTFFDSCETAIANTAKFLAGTQLSDAQHQNIIVCYNQLDAEVGNRGLRITHMDWADYLASPFKFPRNPFFTEYQRLFNGLNANYDTYIDSLKTKYETGFGKGGALYFPTLDVDAKTADGRTYLTLCYEDPVMRMAPDLVGSWEIQEWYLRDISAMDDVTADAYIGKTIVFTPSQLITPFDKDTSVCTSVSWYMDGYVEKAYAASFGLSEDACVKYNADCGNWNREFSLPEENTMIYELDGAVFLCRRKEAK